MYLVVPKEKITKVDPSGKKGIFVGYSENSKAYKYTFMDSRRLISAGT